MNYSTSNFTQEVTLPSNGLLNPEIPDGKVTQRCMMVADQKYLSGSNASSNIYNIIGKTITSPDGFNVENLTTSDALYLLYKLRVLSYGKEYRFRTKCPECGKKIDVAVDLSELPVKTLEDGFQDDLIVKLPNRGDTVYVRVMTVSMMEEMEKEIKRRKRKNPDDESAYILRIVYSIEKIKLAKDKSELTHPIDIERYVNSLTDLDAYAIIDARDSIEFGVDTMYEIECPECHEYIDVNVGISGGFFRPSFNRK